MKATPGQIKRIHSLLPSEVKNDPELKADLVYRYTNDFNRTSTKLLEVSEAKRLISDLSQHDPDKRRHDKCNQMRRKLFALLVHKMYYSEEQLHAWVVKYGKYHKPLMDHSYEELTVLLSQAEIVYKTFIEGIRKDV